MRLGKEEEEEEDGWMDGEDGGKEARKGEGKWREGGRERRME